MVRNLSRQLISVSIIALLCQSVYGADSVVLIDQKAAASGKVTSKDTPGFPVTLSDPGSYRLNGNLVVPDGATTAIEITADNVTLDLNGFSIIGPNTCTPSPTQCAISGGAGIGVVAVGASGNPSPSNVRVFNGTVQGMGGHGIRLLGAGNVVERVFASSNGGPGIVVGDGSVIDSYAHLNAAGAAIIGQIVRGSIATNNITGIAVRPGGLAFGNTANSNDGIGISASEATVVNNTANANGGTGIDALCPAVVSGNTTVGNGTNIATAVITSVCVLSNNAQ
jgi:hypothetical protein